MARSHGIPWTAISIAKATTNFTPYCVREGHGVDALGPVMEGFVVTVEVVEEGT